MRYAQQTVVAVEKSKAEIEKLLSRYGADQFVSGWESGAEDRAVIGFRADSRHIRFELPLPKRSDFTETPGGRRQRSPADAYKAWEQACRQRWRALALVVKAKLEAVESGITTFEMEFLAHIVTPDGQTVGQHVIPAIARAYQIGKMPKGLLPAFGGAE